MGSVVSGVVGGIQAYGNAQTIGKEQLQLGQAQSSIDSYAAGATRQMGAQAAEQSLVKGGQVTGAAATGYATAGVDGQSGTAANSLEDSRMLSSLDSRTVLNNASRQAWGYDAKSGMDLAQSQTQANNTFAEGTTLLTNGMVSAWGSAIGMAAA